nr:type I-E CRISPR-associated protein Cse1/CasA [Streptomyces natalensis]
MSEPDLFHQPWIPVTLVDGTDNTVGLRDLQVQARHIQRLALGVPPAESVLLRILYVLGLRAAGLDAIDADSRYELLEKGEFDPDRVDEYCSRYANRFQLFHPERPWMQDPRLADQMAKPNGIPALTVSRPSKSSSTLFGAFHDGITTAVPWEQAVMQMLCWFGYGQGGPTGVVRATSSNKGRHCRIGPFRGRMSYHPTGRNLFETIVLGIPETDHDPGPGDDPAPWESDLNDPDATPPEVTGPVTLLTGRYQHALLLEPTADKTAVSDAWISWAWPTTLPTAPDPYLIWQENKKGERYPRDAEAHRALFRDLDALLLEHTPDRHAHRPLIMDALHDAPLDVLDHAGVTAYGFAQDRVNAVDHQWWKAQTPPVLRALRAGEHATAARIAETRQAAELAASRLTWALEGIEATTSATGLARAAERDYWPQAEARFWRIVTEHDWQATAFAALALDIYDDIVDTAAATDPTRIIRAAVHQRGKIASLLHRKGPDDPKETAA